MQAASKEGSQKPMTPERNTKFKSRVGQDMGSGKPNKLYYYNPDIMYGRFKQAGFVDPIFGVESLRNQALVEFFCNKYVMQQNQVSPTITEKDIENRKLDPLKNFSKVMRKRDRDHTTRNRGV